jgi:hypothetical protein
MSIWSVKDTTNGSKADDCLGLHGAVDFGSALFYALDFPELHYGQFAVCSMEISDGPVLATDHLSFQDSEDGATQWQVLDSFEAARQQAIKDVTADPSMECGIYDADGRLIHVVRNGQPVPLEELLASQPKVPKAWWQMWR